MEVGGLTQWQSHGLATLGPPFNLLPLNCGYVTVLLQLFGQGPPLPFFLPLEKRRKGRVSAQTQSMTSSKPLFPKPVIRRRHADGLC